MTITTNELLDAIQLATRTTQYATVPPDVFTTNDLAHAKNWGVIATRKALTALKQAGRLELVAVPCEGLDGRTRRIPGYRLLSPKKKA